MYETMAAQLDLWRAGRAGRRTQPDIPRHGKKTQISDAAALIQPAWNRSCYVFNSLLRTYYGGWRPVLCMKPGIEIKTTAIFLPLPSFSAGHDRRVFTGRSIKLEHLCASRSSRGISSSGISTITSFNNWMQARLCTAKKPANILFTDYLSRNAYGKLADRTTQRNQP